MVRFQLKLSCALTLLTLSSLATHAADLELIPGRETTNGNYTKHVYTLRNHSNGRLEQIAVECGIFEGDELVDKAILLFHDIPPNGEAYDDVLTDRTVTDLKCRILR
jgi:hypothetical protein